MSAFLQRPPEGESAKRHAILDAATELFIAQGYGAVSMDAIARAAGVSKATLYAYFRSKDQLFATIIREACQSNLAVQDFLPADQDDVRAALTRLANRMLRFLLEDRSLAIHRVVIAESVRFPELGRAFYESGPMTFTTAFSAWLREQTAAGRLAVTHPERAADQFAGMLKCGCYTRAALGVTPPPSEAEIDGTATGAVETFLKAYAARGE
ncbi:MAG TPA: TetR/AcrR family transcriptional regulator [Acetobacteraceae bacterium]